MVSKSRLIGKFNQFRGSRFVPYLSRKSRPRLYLSKKYLRGNGLEIGAMDHPLKVFNGAHVLYVDRKTVDELRSDFLSAKVVWWTLT